MQDPTFNWSRYLSRYQLGLGARGLSFRDSTVSHLIVDGEIVSGHIVPPAAAGSICNVKVVLGAPLPETTPA